MDPAQAVRTFFLIAASTTLLIRFTPSLRTRFLAYGSRALQPKSKEGVDVSQSVSNGSMPEGPGKGIDGLLDHLATYRVPHGYFTHFYIVSIISSIFWCLQILIHGRAFASLVSLHSSGGDAPSMSCVKVALTWSLMTTQGIRRLYESIMLAKPSQAQMWIGHWLIGIAFYVAMSLAVWVEGIPVLAAGAISFASFSISPPSLRTMCCIPIFLIASGVQHDCHKYLASLQNYTLPTHPAFQHLVCPHYTAECLIYLSLALIAAPEGEAINKTILSALIFVTVNLGITADASKDWYEGKFGKQSVAGRWRMIPLVF